MSVSCYFLQTGTANKVLIFLANLDLYIIYSFVPYLFLGQILHRSLMLRIQVILFCRYLFDKWLIPEFNVIQLFVKYGNIIINIFINSTMVFLRYLDFLNWNIMKLFLQQYTQYSSWSFSSPWCNKFLQGWLKVSPQISLYYYIFNLFLLLFYLYSLLSTVIFYQKLLLVSRLSFFSTFW